MIITPKVETRVTGITIELGSDEAKLLKEVIDWSRQWRQWPTCEPFLEKFHQLLNESLK